MGMGGTEVEKKQGTLAVAYTRGRTTVVARGYDNWIHSRNISKAEPTQC